MACRDVLDSEAEALLSRILTKRDKETDSFLSYVAQEMEEEQRNENGACGSNDDDGDCDDDGEFEVREDGSNTDEDNESRRKRKRKQMKQRQQRNRQQRTDSLFDGCSEDARQRLMDLADEKLQGMSIVLAQRLGPVLKDFIIKDQERRIANSYGRIAMPRTRTREMALNYATCFRQWTQSPFVTYKTANPSDLGAITPLHAFVLHLWAMMTCFRSRSDNMFTICVSGVSSVGEFCNEKHKLLLLVLPPFLVRK